MAGGTYAALSGLRTRMEQLDRLAADLANVNTSGYKSERVTTSHQSRPDFQSTLQTAVDVAAAPGLLDFSHGAMKMTQGELDMALEGRGFFAVQTPGGERYTRNGQFTRGGDGTLTTVDGFAVLGEDGAPIPLERGMPISVEPDGTVRAGQNVAGKLKIVEFSNYLTLSREDGARFRAADATAVRPSANTTVKAGALEQSNVSMVERMAQLTEVGRSFEALQKGISVLMNDIDGRAISELGRR
jgi:flagellar basal-body rod protein FlgF